MKWTEEYERRAQERFWAKVDKSGGPCACWPWTASTQPSGYGQFRYQGRTVYAHRFAMGAVDPTPGLQACHSCDNRICCNPAHLRLGTSRENTQDMVDRGRSNLGKTFNVGERHQGSKLTDQEVRAIRKSYEDGGVSQRDLAKRHGVSQRLIFFVVHKKNWKHVT